MAESEVLLWRKASGHPNVVQLRESFFEVNACFLVMDRCEGGNVSERLEREGPLKQRDDVRDVFRDMLSGLAHVHAVGVAHRDVKPANVLLAGKGWRLGAQLCDFGLSAELPPEPGGRLHRIVGSPPYMSPEMLDAKSGYDERTDVWSFGVTAYLMLFGELPYRPRDTSSAAAMHEVISAGFPRPEFRPSPVCFSARMPSEETVTFVKALLSRPFQKRPFADQALEMPMFAPGSARSAEDSVRKISPGDFIVAAESASPRPAPVYTMPKQGGGLGADRPEPDCDAGSDVSTRPPWSSGTASGGSPLISDAAIVAV